jgi:hypothetical protein
VDIKMQQAKISPLVHETIKFIKQLSKTKSLQKRRHLLKHATVKELLALAEICLNIVSTRFKLTTRQHKRLMPYANFIRKMSRMRSEKGARNFAVQKGSGISGLFGALLTPVLIELARSLIKGEKNPSDPSVKE